MPISLQFLCVYTSFYKDNNNLKVHAMYKRYKEYTPLQKLKVET